LPAVLATDLPGLAATCEAYRAGLLGQPVTALTTLGFVLAGVAVWAGRPAPAGYRAWYGSLVVAVGVGSFIQHGPHPPWQAYAHDLPLAALLGFLAADALRDLRAPAPSPAAAPGRRRWAAASVPVAAVLAAAGVAPLVAAGPTASTIGQQLLAVLAIGANLWRARRRPRLRSVVVPALVLLAVGALLGTLGDRTGLCRPDSLWQGHAAWHLLSAAALWWLTPAVGRRM